MKKYNFKGFVCGFMVASIIAGGLSSLAYAEPFSKQLNAVYNDIKLVIDGLTVSPKDSNGKIVEPFIVAGTTYLPVRAVAETLGKEVDWDAQTNTVYIGQKFKIKPIKEGNIGIVDFVEQKTPYEGSLDNFHIGHTIKSIDDTERPYIEVRQKKYDVQNVIYHTFTEASATYLLNGEFKRLTGKFASDDWSENKGILKIYTDGQLVLDTSTSRGDEIQNIDISLIGVDEFTIRMERYYKAGIIDYDTLWKTHSFLFDVEFEPLEKYNI